MMSYATNDRAREVSTANERMAARADRAFGMDIPSSVSLGT